MTRDPRPASGAEAVLRALRLLRAPDNAQNGYQLGGGNYHPVTLSGHLVDVPWTQVVDRSGAVHVGCDCAGLICWAYKLPRHRPGFNRGGKFDVDDDLNTSSMLGDAFGERDCWTLVTDSPRPGDVILYPSFSLYDPSGHVLVHDGVPLRWIGHCAIVIDTSRVIPPWSHVAPRWDELDVIQVRGPNGRTPAAIRTDGSLFAHHDLVWPRTENRSWLIRALA